MDFTSLSAPVRDVLTEVRLFDLGPGRPQEKMRQRLAALSPDTLLMPNAVRRAEDAEACLAALWLYHDFLEEAHALSQSIDTANGSYWHGIMHRREPDAANAAYWFRRVGTHPIFVPLANEARSAGLELSADHWDPFAFIDLCEKHRGTGTPDEMTLRRVQHKEWELLFDWCRRRAAGEQ
jgi:hypothetical protein